MHSVRGWSRCCLRRAITSRFLTAKRSTPGCISTATAAPRAGCRVRCSNWHTISVRLIRWAKTGVLEGVVQALQQGLLVDSDIDTLSLDSTIIHVHMHGTSARRNGGAERSAAFGVA